MKKIRGIQEETVKVGGGLLSVVSQGLKSRRMEIVKIPREKIQKDPENYYHIDEDLSDLQYSIEHEGLKSPLEVFQLENGNYQLIGGERRITAIDTLIENGKRDNFIECIVIDLDEIKLPLSKEGKIAWARTSSNSTQRKYSDADRAKEIKELERLFSDIRNAKEEEFPELTKEEFHDLQAGLKGIKTRDAVADVMGISHAQVAKFKKVENKGSNALIDTLNGNRINVATAAQVASMPKEKQEEVINKVLEKKLENEKITSDDVLKAEHQILHEKPIPERPEEKTVNEPEENATRENAKEDTVQGTLLTEKMFKEDIKGIMKKIKESNGVTLDEKSYMSYLKYIRAVESAIEKAEK